MRSVSDPVERELPLGPLLEATFLRRGIPLSLRPRATQRHSREALLRERRFWETKRARCRPQRAPPDLGRLARAIGHSQTDVADESQRKHPAPWASDLRSRSGERAPRLNAVRDHLAADTSAVLVPRVRSAEGDSPREARQVDRKHTAAEKPDHDRSARAEGRTPDPFRHLRSPAGPVLDRSRPVHPLLVCGPYERDPKQRRRGRRPRTRREYA